MSELLVTGAEVTTITINRPDKRNALTVDLAKQIASVIKEKAATARVLIVTGAGRAFCAGGDFEELLGLAEADPGDSARHLYEGFQGAIRAVREAPVPVIAAVNGAAVGAGMDFALSSDIRIASTDAKFGQVWAKLGIIPGTGGAFWTTLLAGPSRAAQLLMTGEIIDAETALEYGLAGEVVPPDQLLRRCEEIAEAILANPRDAIAANKKALNEAIRPGYEAALEYAVKVQPERFASTEFKDALKARLRSSRERDPK